ncbi:MAG: invasion associated locus B family protein [Alphaproteobacteria bacterium]|nr:invasion associated locus B family protein [Alphaproteobacteria bacterium]
MRRGNRTFARILVCALAAAAAPALAQQQPPAPVQTAPQQTTATYEDWVVRCETRAGPPPAKNCEMVQFTRAQGQTGVLTQIAIGKPVRGQPIKIVVQVPIAVWLPTGVRLTTGARDPGVAASFKRCLPTACFADTDVKDDVIKRFRSSKDAGQLQFKDVNLKDVALPVSFKGFSAAYDALAKE